MAEYAGYVASAPINYGQITEGLVSNVIAIDQAKREEDKKAQLEFDKYFDDTTKDVLKDYELSKSQTWNDAMYPVADGIKKVLLAAQKSGSKQQVNMVSSNAKTGLKNIKTAKDVIDANMGTLEKLTLEDKISPMGNVYAKMYSGALDFKNKGFPVMTDGTIPYVSYDDKGEILSTNDIMDPASLANVTPFIDQKIDYDKSLNEWVSKLGTSQNEVGKVTTINPALNPAFPKAKETKITELTSTPRNSARFLSSVAGYQGYDSEEAKKELLSKGITEDKLIQVKLINGVPEPILTDKQQAAAKEIAAQQIDQRIGIKRYLDEDRIVTDPNASILAYLKRKELEEKSDLAKKMAPIVSRVKIADKVFNSTNPKDWGPLKQAAKLNGIKNPTISQQSDGSKILYGIPKGKRKPEAISTFSSGGEIYAYTTGSSNVIQGLGEYNEGLDYMQSNQPAPAPAQAPASGKNVTMGQINAMTSAQRGGLNATEYAKFLKSQGYTIK
jgi:hypothetical protein